MVQDEKLTFGSYAYKSQADHAAEHLLRLQNAKETRNGAWRLANSKSTKTGWRGVVVFWSVFSDLPEGAVEEMLERDGEISS